MMTDGDRIADNMTRKAIVAAVQPGIVLAQERYTTDSGLLVVVAAYRSGAMAVD